MQAQTYPQNNEPPADQVQRQGALRLLMWLYLVSMFMIFAGLTSAYLVRQAAGNWRQFALPSLFYVNTGLILLSSLTMQLAFRAAKHDQITRLQVCLWLTTLLGAAFLIGQFVAWQQLIKQNIHLVGNASESFVYVLTGLHGLHLVAAIIVLIVTLIQAIRYRISSRHLIGLELSTTFWHALDFLWIYLFVFLAYTHAQ